MTLVKCTECGKEVSGDAASCPNCGAPIAASPMVASQVQGKGEGIAMSSMNCGCMIVLAVAALTLLGFCFAFSRLLRR